MLFFIEKFAIYSKLECQINIPILMTVSHLYIKKIKNQFDIYIEFNQKKLNNLIFIHFTNK